MNRRKELKEQYKARVVTGGIYRITNRENGRFYLRETDDIQATRNWFQSCRKFGTCYLPAMQADWKEHGPEAFLLEELDLLEKAADQSSQEFQQDLKALWELWDEKLPKENRY